MSDPKQQIAAMTREQLEDIAYKAHEADLVVDEWLGSASTRQAATDCLWRLRKALEAAGLTRGYRLGQNWRPLQWRGSVFKALDQYGFGVSDEEPPHIRERISPWDACGRTLQEVLDQDPTSFDRYWEAAGGVDLWHVGVTKQGGQGTISTGVAGFQIARMKEAMRLAYLAGQRCPGNKQIVAFDPR